MSMSDAEMVRTLAPAAAPLWRRVSLHWLVAAALTIGGTAVAQTSAHDDIAQAIARDGQAVVIVEFRLRAPRTDATAADALDDRRADIAAARGALSQDLAALGLGVEDEFDSLPIIVTRVSSVEVLNKLIELPRVKAVTLNSRERSARER